MKNYKIAVAGTGYVGLSLGVLFAQHHQVVAVDIVQAKVDMINNKKSPIQDDYIEKYLAEKDLNLTATLDAKAACLYFLFDIILQTFQQIARGLGKNTLYSVSTIVNATINMMLIYILINVFDLGLSGVIGAVAVANLCASLFLFYKSGLAQYISFEFISIDLTRQMIAYAWPLIPNNLSSWVMTLSDRLLLSMFLGVEVNAVYAVAKKIPNLLTAVQSTFSLAWQENIAMRILL